MGYLHCDALVPRLPPRLLHEETGLDRLDEDLVRVVSETLQLDAAGACLFSYLLKAKPDGYSDGLCRACTPYAPAHRAVSQDPLLRHHHHCHIHIE
jgi:hypothetical protein